MTFSQTVKSEFLEQLKTKNNIFALLETSFLLSNSQNNELQNSQKKIIKQIEKLLIKFKIKHHRKARNIIIDEKIALKQKANWEWIFLGTLFLFCGSISPYDSIFYHLEFRFKKKEIAFKAEKILAKNNLHFNTIYHHNYHTLYLKKSDQIADFLKFIKVIKSLLLFENTRISRDLQNNLNRFANLDLNNQKKLALANQKFLSDYQKIIDSNMESYFHEKELAFFKVKKNNSYSSLSELEVIYFEESGYKATKSAFNHWLRKLRKIVATI